jgi:hypothetical protein
MRFTVATFFLAATALALPTGVTVDLAPADGPITWLGEAIGGVASGVLSGVGSAVGSVVGGVADGLGDLASDVVDGLRGGSDDDDYRDRGYRNQGPYQNGPYQNNPYAGNGYGNQGGWRAVDVSTGPAGQGQWTISLLNLDSANIKLKILKAKA